MIVDVHVPDGITSVRYGGASMVPDANVLQVPAYVAKELITLAGFTSIVDLSATASALLSAGAIYEANYLFWAYGNSLPDAATRITDALNLLSDRGQPAVSAS